MTARSKIVGLTRHIENGSVEDMDNHIRDHDLDAGVGQFTAETEVFDYAESDYADEDSSAPSGTWKSYVTPVIIVMLTLGWTGYFIWTYLPLIKDGLKGEYLITLISIWATPAMFLAILWLLAMRSSRAEALRFRDAKDVLTFLYDREQAMKSLEALEAGWGGNIEQRMAAKYAAFQGQPADPPPLDPTG